MHNISYLGAATPYSPLFANSFWYCISICWGDASTCMSNQFLVSAYILSPSNSNWSRCAPARTPNMFSVWSKLLQLPKPTLAIEKKSSSASACIASSFAPARLPSNHSHNHNHNIDQTGRASIREINKHTPEPYLNKYSAGRLWLKSVLSSHILHAWHRRQL